MVEFNTQDGTQRGMKFGTYTFQLINEIAGTTTTEEVFERLSGGGIEFASQFYFACAKHYALSKKQPVDFTELDVMDWLDDLGPQEVTRITTELLNTFTAKNLMAPKTQGPKEQVPQ